MAQRLHIWVKTYSGSLIYQWGIQPGSPPSHSWWQESINDNYMKNSLISSLQDSRVLYSIGRCVHTSKHRWHKGDCTAGGSSPVPTHSPLSHWSTLRWDRSGSGETESSYRSHVEQLIKTDHNLTTAVYLHPGTDPVTHWGCQSRSRNQTSADMWRTAPQSDSRL